MTLQLVHTGTRPVRASSLYCCWIRVPGKGGPLRAIWIDSEMRVFEPQLAGETGEGALIDEADQSQWPSAEARVLELSKRS